ncbi:Ig-like domain-containing protein [Nocardiopsis alba]|uniref:Ig-like domain-containing protein n=1 Tax=Nocardiopsis alba TaxID=53437 RepID=UPI0036B0FE5B
MATQQLTAELTMTDDSTEDVTSSATWTSSDEAVATVSSGGLVTSVGPGTCTITAAHSGLTGTSAVTVTEPAPEPESLSVSPATVSLEHAE